MAKKKNAAVINYQFSISTHYYPAFRKRHTNSAVQPNSAQKQNESGALRPFGNASHKASQHINMYYICNSISHGEIWPFGVETYEPA